MKQALLYILLLWAAAGAFLSCSDDDTITDSTLSSRDCLIINAVLGTLNRELHTLNSEGEDSVYYVNVTGSYYPLSIDHIGGHIFNNDSLPYGTDITKVTLKTFSASGATLIDRWAEEGDTLFNKADSTDYSRERYIKVFSPDATVYRTYRMEIRVHREEADSFVWQEMAHDVATLNAAADCHLLAADGHLYLYTADTNGQLTLTKTTATEPDFNNTLTSVETLGGQPLSLRSLIRFGGRFYGLAAGQLAVSDNGHSGWQSLGHTALGRLLAATPDSLYALNATHDRILSTADGMTWRESAADEPDFLPNSRITAAYYTAKTDERLATLLMGGRKVSRNDDGTENVINVVWRHDIDKKNGFRNDWMYLPQTEELGDVAYPDLQSPVSVGYDHSAMLAGLDEAGNLAPFYFSNDNGRTWRPDTRTQPLAGPWTSMAMAVDEQQYVWLVGTGNGQVMRGRINRLNWKDTDSIFQKPQEAGNPR